MWLTLLLGAINFAVALFGRKLLRLPGFDITPFAMILLAQSGENILFGALVLTVAFAQSSMKRLRYLWLTLPATILIGYLALVVPSAVMLLLIYHLVCFLFAFLLGFFGFRYLLFLMVNMGLNLALVRLHALFL